MLTHFRLTILLSVLALSACSSDGGVRIPGLYRIDIQQGNVIDQVMIDRLRPGMDRHQVQFILGTPAIADPFHANQWIYFYSMSESGDTRQQRQLRVHFTDDKLAWIDGDVVSTGRIPEDALRQTKTVDVPLREREGLFKRFINSLPFVGDDEPQEQVTSPAEEPAEQP